jgi:hypothetical protein
MIVGVAVAKERVKKRELEGLDRRSLLAVATGVMDV